MTTLDVTVEIFVDGAWLDITRLDEDTHVVGAVTIVRGGSDEQSESAPTSVTFRYLDNNLTLDADNPYSAYFRKISVPGTPLRVLLDGEVRASVELVDMPVEPGSTPEENYFNVEAAGKLRSLDQGQKPLRSPAYRAFTAPVNDPYRVAYFPFEEESGATGSTSPTPGAAVTLGGPGTIEFGALESMSSARLAQFGSFDTFITLTLPTWTNSLGQHLVGSLMRWPEAGLTARAILYRFYFTGGTIDYVDLQGGIDLSLRLLAYSGSTLIDTLAVSDWSGIADQESFLWCTFHQNGADVDVRIRATTATSWAVGVSDTMTAQTLGQMYQIVMGTGTGAEGVGFGHVIVGSNKDSMGNFVDDLDSDSSYLVTGARGYEFETVGARMSRLSDEVGITVTVTGDEADTERLAVQGTGTFLQLLREGAEVDMGILGETRTEFEVEYRTRASLYNQTTPYALTFAHLQPGFRPARSDLRVTNDVTVDRPGGAAAQYVVPDGDYFHWSTEEPPDGAGVRDLQESRTAAADTQLDDLAAWIAHLGSWREKRFSAVPLEVTKPVFDADDVAFVRSLDVGDILPFDMTGAPRYVPYDELRLLVRGYTEVLSKHLHTITFNTTPADPYEVTQVDSGGTSLLANAIDDNDTSLKIAPGTGKPWSESATDLPYHIQVAGQPMTVTAISTDTAAFIAAGAVSYADNAAVTPALPAGMTPDVGQLMVAYVFRRASGAGIIGATPTDWATIADSANGDWKLAGRYYRTGDAAVQYTVSGGAANDTVGGVVLGFSGLSMVLDKNIPAGYSAGYVTSVNSSAQNIAYPVYLNRRTKSAMLLVGKKDDDWTSVATVAGTSELVDSSSATGSDVGVVIDLYNPGTPTTVAAGSFTVTGGASAVSEGTVFGLRPLQTATVTRGVAGVAVAAVPGAEIHGWRMGVTGL